MGLSKRQHRAAFMLGILLFGVATGALVVFAANHLTNTVQVGPPVTVHAPSGPAVTINEPADVNMTDMFPAADTVRLWTSKGNVTISGANFGNVTIDNINGTYTNTSSLEVIGKPITIDPGDKEAVTVSGDITDLDWRQSMATDDGTVDFVYDSSIGSGSITLNGLPANTKIAAIDADTNTVLDVATSDGSGSITYSGLDSGSHNVVLQTGGNAPVLSNPSPTGSVSSSPNSISIDVNDSDFPGDELEVIFKIDGSTVDTVNTTQNGTVSTSSFSTLDLGPHTASANVTDAFGQQTNTSWTFQLPQNVTFRNESNATQVITGVNITATFYSVDGTTVIQRSDSNDDGNISLAGLPNTEFVIVVEANGYYTRRMYIESIFNQENIYLLNSTAYPNAIDTTFVYEDRTGNFPNDDTTLRVQRAVDVDGDDTFAWETVAGDFWGAAGEFPFTGQENVRYRLLIENGAGTQRNLGTHIPVADGVKNIVVGQLQWPIINGTAKDFTAEIDQDSSSVLATYYDPDNKTTEVRVRVWELGNESNEIVDQNFSSGPYGTLNANLTTLNANQSQMSWVVNATAETSDDGTVAFQVTIGSSPLDLPIDPWLLGTFAWIGMTFVATLYGPRTARLGAGVLVIFAGMLMLMQLVYIPPASLILAIGIVVGGTLYKEALP